MSRRIHRMAVALHLTLAFAVGAPADTKCQLPAPGTPDSLRAATEHLAGAFGPRYSRAGAFLARLDALDAADRDAFAALHRRALLANPLVADAPILFVTRPQYRRDHHNTATLFQTGEINTGKFSGPGALKLLDVRTGEVTTLLEAPEGVIRDPEVRFDARRVVFAMRRNKADDYHIYELDVPARQLRQLTFGSGVSDIDPLYLPDGRIAFSSTREPKFCMCNRHIMANLFRMNADGTNIEQIGRSTLFEGHGSLTPDGRILYDRWEYVDRNFGDAQGLWTCNPDGTNHAVFYGNNTPSPGGILDPRVVPGRGERFVATYSSCHDRPWGAIAVVDRSRGMDSLAGRRGRAMPELHIWPAKARGHVGRGNYDRFRGIWPKYEDPFPLHDPNAPAAAGRFFLCSRMTGEGERMGIVLLDTFGNELLVHAEGPGCYDPMPLAPRRRPGVMPDRTDLAREAGTFYVHDVYRGTGMEAVRRGTVKRLRVVESPEKRFWTGSNWNGSGTQAPGMAWDDFNNKRILGSAPVEPDGSAYFAVPADRFVYFQLLDANGMMVQSMRSGTIARPGETTGCVGCHEDRHSVVANGHAAAMAGPASPLEPWYGPARKFNYLAEVQPVFDRHCVRCHDVGKPGGKKLLLAGDLTLIFNLSYIELRRKKLVKVPGAGPADILPPKSWGSHASKLIAVLRAGHNDVKLPGEDFDRLVTWIDINAPYYPVYASAYRKNRYGRSPLDRGQIDRLSKLVGLKLNTQPMAGSVNFTRPALSTCLAGLGEKNPAACREALAIIEAGRAALAERPRAEMPGFRLAGEEARRQATYEACAAALARLREAILAGERLRLKDFVAADRRR